MEHWLVAIGPGQSDAALDWAARHAKGRAALEVIASDLEVPDPQAAILRAEARLRAARSSVPRALHAVPTSLADQLARRESVDLVVLGSPRGPLGAGEIDRVLSLVRLCRSPVVLVPVDGPVEGLVDGPADDEPRVIEWPEAHRRPTAGLRAQVGSGRGVVRIERPPAPAHRRWWS